MVLKNFELCGFEEFFKWRRWTLTPDLLFGFYYFKKHLVLCLQCCDSGQADPRVLICDAGWTKDTNEQSF